jgi:spermidine/putrescine transport system permease protein
MSGNWYWASRKLGLAKPRLREIFIVFLAGFLSAFNFSFEDFIIAYFVAGPDTTLPIYVFSSIRRGVTPEINAVGTVVLLTSFALLIVAQIILQRGQRKPRAE